MNKKYGFTIVELLVVIVIIGILAAITIVSYTGITSKAVAAALQSDLTNASQKLKIFQLRDDNPSGNFPTTIDCGIPDSATNLCLRASGSNTFGSSYVPNNTAIPKTFTLDASNSATVYRITNDSSPVAVTSTPITAIGAIVGTTDSVGSVLTAGAVVPSGATVGYQWQSATTAGGTYTNISSTANTYTLSIGDVGKYIKVIATGSGGYSGSQTSAASTVVSDANWILAGTQVWAKYNLNVGTRVNGATTQTDNAIVEKYCYDDNESNCTTYGGLYQWNEAMQYSTTEGTQGVCPVGSHVPFDSEWTALVSYLGDSTAGTQLQPGGASGLNIPLAGYRNNAGYFSSLSSSALLWSSLQSGVDAYGRWLSSGGLTVGWSYHDKNNGFSVRCIGN